MLPVFLTLFLFCTLHSDFVVLWFSLQAEVDLQCPPGLLAPLFSTSDKKLPRDFSANKEMIKMPFLHEHM